MKNRINDRKQKITMKEALASELALKNHCIPQWGELFFEGAYWVLYIRPTVSTFCPAQDFLKGLWAFMAIRVVEFSSGRIVASDST